MRLIPSACERFCVRNTPHLIHRHREKRSDAAIQGSRTTVGAVALDRHAACRGSR